jgi:hypothetical protein
MNSKIGKSLYVKLKRSMLIFIELLFELDINLLFVFWLGGGIISLSY